MEIIALLLRNNAMISMLILIELMNTRILRRQISQRKVFLKRSHF